MREFFLDTAFHAKSLRMIELANSIIAEYQSQGFTLTLRQLYYQFVARDLFLQRYSLRNNKWVKDDRGTINAQPNYDNLGKLISDARLAGLVDWRAMEDRTRFLRGRINWENPAEMLAEQRRRYSIDMWENQNNRIEVWIEKDALVGVIESVCHANDVNYFACRGYVSQSELYDAGKRIESHRDNGQETIVIHLGDHDPSGIDMTRDNQERLSMFSNGYVEVYRVALNYEQVKRYNPPPNPAKMTDSRVGGYIAAHGYSSWELDALEPTVLQSLIQDTINEYKDADAWNERIVLLNEHRQQIDACIAQLKG